MLNIRFGGVAISRKDIYDDTPYRVQVIAPGHAASEDMGIDNNPILEKNYLVASEYAASTIMYTHPNAKPCLSETADELTEACFDGEQKRPTLPSKIYVKGAVLDCMKEFKVFPDDDHFRVVAKSDVNPVKQDNPFVVEYEFKPLPSGWNL